MYLLLIFIFISSSLNASLHKLPLHNSGTRVSFQTEALPEPEPEKTSKEMLRYKKRLRPTAPAPKKMVTFQRFIRVVNTIGLTNGQYVSLDFFDKGGKLISQNIIENTRRPSGNHLFGQHRDAWNKFKGLKDIYHIPANAEYFQINFYDMDNNILATAKDSMYFTDRDKVLISDYISYQKNNRHVRILFQIELLGSIKNLSTKVGAFNVLR